MSRQTKVRNSRKDIFSKFRWLDNQHHCSQTKLSFPWYIKTIDFEPNVRVLLRVRFLQLTHSDSHHNGKITVFICMFGIISRRTGNHLDVFIMKSSYLNFVRLNQHNQTPLCLLTLCSISAKENTAIKPTQANPTHTDQFWRALNCTLSKNQHDFTRDTWGQSHRKWALCLLV